jgi:hypothetical protein
VRVLTSGVGAVVVVVVASVVVVVDSVVVVVASVEVVVDAVVLVGASVVVVAGVPGAGAHATTRTTAPAASSDTPAATGPRRLRPNRELRICSALSEVRARQVHDRI